MPQHCLALRIRQGFLLPAAFVVTACAESHIHGHDSGVASGGDGGLASRRFVRFVAPVLCVVLTAVIAALRSRARSAGYGWLGIALLVGCGSPATITAEAGTVDPADAAMEPEASSPSCELTQVPLAQPAAASTTLVTARSIFIGDARGLWRSSGIGERFERVTSIPGDSRGVVTLVGFDDGAIFAVIGEGRVLMSRDDGERWEELVELPPVSGGG